MGIALPLYGIRAATVEPCAPERPDETRVTDLHTTHAGPLLRFLTVLTRGDRHAADDIFQETMLRAWRNLDSVPVEHESQRRWLFTVGRRIAIDTARMRQARPTEVGMTEAVHVADDDATDRTLNAYLLKRAFTQLTADHRTVLGELYLAGRPVEEVAGRLNIPPGTVKSRAHYALRSLRTAIGSVV